MQSHNTNDFAKEVQHHSCLRAKDCDIICKILVKGTRLKVRVQSALTKSKSLVTKGLRVAKAEIR